MGDDYNDEGSYISNVEFAQQPHLMSQIIVGMTKFLSF